ncbi:DUF732 domain-containing protein [Mycolicibacterium frederiksbergense]|uniref:DUF732 domain-containing protein n=1 Tax=Mycolicibacterium frederiksbergense TaxID=117567 RepID=UPI00143C453A|nr:DUF732 domain-containing protein [Mycolicibacterium frederiksbergense]
MTTCCVASARAFAALSVLTGALVAALVAPAIANAEPGCLEFRNPVTGACEPYVVNSDVEYHGEAAFLTESGTLFAGSTGEDVLELGYSICRSLGRGTPPNEIAQKMVSGGVDTTSAVQVLKNAQKLLC